MKGRFVIEKASNLEYPKKVNLIKAIRRISGLGLKEAKYIADDVTQFGSVEFETSYHNPDYSASEFLVDVGSSGYRGYLKRDDHLEKDIEFLSDFLQRKFKNKEFNTCKLILELAEKL